MRIDELIRHARGFVEGENHFNAALMYRIVLQETKAPYTTPTQRIARGEACAYFARRKVADRELGAAGDWYRKALEADPRGAEYRCEYALRVLLPMGLDESALIEARRATQLEPDVVRTWRTLATIEHAAGTLAGSRVARARALELAPDDPVILLDQAVVAIDGMDYAEARKWIAKVSLEHPEREGDALHLAACIAYRNGAHEEAIEIFDKALEIGVEDPAMCRWNRALALQSIGRYKEGWAEYEQRGFQKAAPEFSVPMRRFVKPIWAGEPPPARLHLHEEMGHGDTLALCRYAPFLADRGYDVCLEVRDSMVDLFRRSMPNVKIVPRALDHPGALGVPDFDYHLPLMSAPHACGIDVDTVPWSGSYLNADPETAEECRQRLGIVKSWCWDEAKVPRPRKIGLCWSSGIRKGIWLGEYGRRKSTSFDALRPIWMNDANVWCISLQSGPPAKEMGEDRLPGIGEEEPSWDTTAAIINHCDLVITVDSAVAHLAGAMGKPTWLMMHTEGSWHWMADTPGAPWRERSPWYPSVRIFRQERANEWAPVIERIRRELAELR